MLPIGGFQPNWQFSPKLKCLLVALQVSQDLDLSAVEHSFGLPGPTTSTQIYSSEVGFSWEVENGSFRAMFTGK